MLKNLDRDCKHSWLHADRRLVTAASHVPDDDTMHDEKMIMRTCRLSLELWSGCGSFSSGTGKVPVSAGRLL